MTRPGKNMLHRPKKSLGQNFLTSPQIARAIVEAGDVVADDIILEIGPGKGILTQDLLSFAGKVVAIEKDNELISFLNEKFASEISSGKLEILEKDILDFDPNIMGFYELGYTVIANIPYYITGKILKQFLENSCQPKRMVLMLQKEVAERIIGGKQSQKKRKESILSISVKAYGKPKIIRTVKAGAFFPKPNVDSAILAIENISKTFFSDFSEKTFFKIVKTGFKSKRKKLIGNLSSIANPIALKEIFLKMHLDENSRAEDLSLEDWEFLAKELN